MNLGMNLGYEVGEVVKNAGWYAFPLDGSLTCYSNVPAVVPTFARTTDASYQVGSTGLLASAAIDTARYETYLGRTGWRVDNTRTNLRTYSDATADWTPAFVTLGASAVAGPDGVVAGIKGIIPDATSNVHGISRTMSSLTESVYYGCAFRYKPGASPWCWISIYWKDAGSTTLRTDTVRYNVLTGASDVLAGTVAFHGVSPRPSANGYYRCMAMIQTPATTSKNTFYLGVGAVADGAQTFTGDAATVYGYIARAYMAQGGPIGADIATDTASVQNTSDSLTYPNLVAPSNHAVYAEALPEFGLGATPTAFRLVTFNSASGATAIGRTQAGAAYACAPQAAGGYSVTFKTADLSYTDWNRCVYWVRQDTTNVKYDIYLNGVLKVALTAAGTLGNMETTTQIGAYSTSPFAGLLRNVVNLNNPSSGDVVGLSKMGG